MKIKQTNFRYLLITTILVLILISGACSTKNDSTLALAASQNFAADSATTDTEITSALRLIEKMPDSPTGYNKLAAVYIKKARESGDFSLNAKAEMAVDQALKIEPQNLPARKLQASLNLTFHRFQNALELGWKLQQEFPNAAFVYGILTDAHVELGNYIEAIDAAQKMVDLKPNTASYARISHLRSLHGDHEGAIEMMTLAARIADPLDKEAQSWCLVELGKKYFKKGDFAKAEKIYDEALEILPEYNFALTEKGIIRAAQNDFETAAKYLSKSQNLSPQTETIIVLGNIYAKLDDPEKAKRQYALAEVIEQNFNNTDLRRLALLWADNDMKLDEALAISEREYAARKDIHTADIYSWCLYKKGKLQEAKVVIREAMRLKTKDALFFYHAGMIEKDLGNPAEAKRLLELALKLNPAFDFLQADKARKVFEELK